MRRRRPALSIERVVDELRKPLVFHGRRPERIYLVLAKRDQQIHLGTLTEDIEQQVETLMSDLWVPLGFVSYNADSSEPETNPLHWYADLLTRDEKRYRRLYGTVSARLEEAAARLTNELSEGRVIQRVQ